MSLLDPITNGPNLGVVHRLLPPQDQEIPYELSVVLGSSPEMGAAHEALGNIDSALSWYHLGQYRWRSDEPFVLGSDGSEAVARRYAFPDQLSAAMCAERVGERERAYQLYGWTVDYLIYKKEKYPSYSYFWDMQPKMAYVLICLGRWNEALALAEEAQHEVDGSTDYFEKQNNSSVRLLPVILGVARYYVDPTSENRQNAMDMIHPQTVACLWHPAHLEALLYLYALRSRLPDLANPPAHEATLPETVWHTARTCRETMAEGGLELDGTPGSLKRLDPVMRELYKRYANEPEHRKNLFLMCGSYFGEVIREELAGGQWRLSPKGLLDSTLRWEFGETSYEIQPFGHLRAYLEGRTENTLFAFWQETEAAFMQCALSARYAD